MVKQVFNLSNHEKNHCQDLSIPFYGSSVSAGFPSPADDYIEASLDLNKHLIKHPAATFFVRVQGDSMENAGIFHQDMVIVDRSLTPQHGHVIIAVLQGEFTIKRLHRKDGIFILLPENPKYLPIKITESMDFSVWGVVTTVIHDLYAPSSRP